MAMLVGLGLIATVPATPSDGAEKAARKKQAEITLQVWIMPNAPSDNEKHFAELIRPFSEANPRIKVVPTVLRWNVAWDRIQDAVSGGPAPDLMQLGTSWVAAIAATGMLVDLSGKYDQSLFPPQVLATTMIEGQLGRFAMPWIVDTRALYYNKAACAKAGIDPTRDFATWASFKTALRKLKDIEVDGKHPWPLGVSNSMAGRDGIHNLSWWLWGAGGGFVARGAGENGIDSPGSRDGIEYYSSLFREGLMSPKADKETGYSVMDMFRRGDLATTIALPIPSLPEDRFGVTLVPEGPRGRFSFLGGSTLAVLKSSKHPEQAVALIKFLSSEAAQVRYSTLTGILPAAAAEYDELLLKLHPVLATFVEEMRYGRAYPSIAQWGDIENVLHEGIEKVWLIAKKPGPYDKTGVGDELDKMAKKIDGILHAPAKTKSNR